MFGKRPDATLCRDVPQYRRMMPYLMRGRNESAVYFMQQIDVTRTLAFLDDFNATHSETRATLFHVVLWATVRTLAERPRLNRFTAGGQLWQRDGIWIAYSIKKRKDDQSPIAVLKQRFEAQTSFEATLRTVYDELARGRSDDKSYVDKELGALLQVPGPLLRGVLAIQRAADALGVLPKAFIDRDPLYASAFIANLGSLKMDAGYHHLYEYGNIPIFCVIGQTTEQPVVRAGQVVAQPTATLRYTFDERAEDGLYAQRSLELLRARVEDPVANGA
jgi:hypothetical protein